MADETQVIKGIKWREVFEWTHLFRAFRVAVHPSKLILGLLALLSIYLGGRVLDAIWPAGASAVPGELLAYANWSQADDARRPDSFHDIRKSGLADVHRSYARLLRDYGVAKDFDQANALAEKGDSLGELQKAIHTRLDESIKSASESRDKSLEEAAKITDDRQRDEKEKSIKHDWQQSMRADYATAAAELKKASAIKLRGPFITLFEWQVDRFELIVNATVSGQILGPGGTVQAIWDFATVGPCWLLTQHPWYFLIFASWFLLSWALFGGAIARIAALHVARDEKPSVRMALRFSASKVASFFCAPLIPLLIILVIGLLIAAGGFLGNIPGIGPVILGALFILVLAAAFIITLMLLGLIGGLNLMYPAIAVEGTDSFDAISRSFNYAYARPWRLGFYSLVSLAYGSVCYLFVRFVIFLVLSVAHAFAGWWFFARAGSTDPLWATMWPAPQLGDFAFHPNFTAMGPVQSFGAWLLAFWIYLAIALVGAFAISFYFSANTLIYTLLRRNVDNTELDAVFIEQVDEEFSEASPVTPVATPVPSPVSSSTEGPVTTTPSATTEAPTPISPAVDAPAPQPQVENPPAANPPSPQSGNPDPNPPAQQ